MPALNVAASPVAVAVTAATGNRGNAANNSAADAETATPFASVLSGQMNGTGSAATEAGARQPGMPPDADAVTERTAQDLAALLPMLLGASDAAGAEAAADKGGHDPAGSNNGSIAQAELALTLLTPPVAAAVVAVAGQAVDAPAAAGNTGAAPPFIPAAESAASQRTMPIPPAIVAASETLAATAASSEASSKPNDDAPRPSFAATVLDRLQREGGSKAAAGEAGDAHLRATLPEQAAPRELAAPREQAALPEQAMVPMHATAAARHAAADGTYRITPALGSRQWESAVGNSLVFMTGQQQGSAELVLTPPQLGRIEISLTVSGDQATATFVSASPTVREALNSAMPRLTEILADAGITLSHADVNAGSPEQSSGNDDNGNHSRRATTPDFAGAGSTGAAGVTDGGRTGRGLVDVFA